MLPRFLCKLTILLTIFTVILLPLTLIAGIYGMNGLDLNNIEALPGGFILVIIMMTCVGVGLVVFFIKKQWLLVREKELQNSLHTEDKESPKDSGGKSHVEYHVFKRGKGST